MAKYGILLFRTRHGDRFARADPETSPISAEALAFACEAKPRRIVESREPRRVQHRGGSKFRYVRLNGTFDELIQLIKSFFQTINRALRVKQVGRNVVLLT